MLWVQAFVIQNICQVIVAYTKLYWPQFQE